MMPIKKRNSSCICELLGRVHEGSAAQSRLPGIVWLLP